MLLIFTSDHIAETFLVSDDSIDRDRKLYRIGSTPFGHLTSIVGHRPAGHLTFLATMHFHKWRSDTISVFKGLEGRKAKKYITKPSWISRRRVFTVKNGTTFEWKPMGDTWTLSLLHGPEVVRPHSYSSGSRDPAQQQYLEFSDDPRVLNSLDELVIAIVYLRLKQEKQRRKSRNAAHSHHQLHGKALGAADDVKLVQNNTDIPGGGGTGGGAGKEGGGAGKEGGGAGKEGGSAGKGGAGGATSRGRADVTSVIIY